MEDGFACVTLSITRCITQHMDAVVFIFVLGMLGGAFYSSKTARFVSAFDISHGSDFSESRVP